MSLATLTKTVFSTGPDDALATVDVYKKRSSSVVNSIQAVVDSAGLEDGPLGLIKSAIDKVPGVNYLTDLVEGNSREDILKRFSADDSTLKSTFRDLSEGVQKAFKAGAGVGSVAKAVFNGQTSQLIKRGLNDARTISTMVDRFTKGNYKVNFKDFGSVSGLVSSLAYEGSRLGLPNTFTTMAATISEKGILLASARDLIPRAIKNRDMNLFLDMSNSSIGRDLRNLNPNGIRSMVSGFKIRKGDAAYQLSNYYDQVSTGFSRVDPLWKSYSRNGNQVMSASQISASDDFKRLIEAKAMSRPLNVPRSFGGIAPIMPIRNDDESFLMLLKKYDLTSVKSELKKLIPTVKVRTDINVKDYECTAADNSSINDYRADVTVT
jgi:hypothetical protein